MKKLLSMLLVIALLCGCVGCSSKPADNSDATTTTAPQANPASDFKYGKHKDGKAIGITEYLGTAKDVVIPATIDGLPVTTIGSCAFYTDTITSVYIPDTVEFIAYRAFYHASNLTSVRFGSGLQEIDSEAFRFCESLKAINLPEGLEKIGYEAFSSCTSVTEISLPGSLQHGGMRIFADNPSVTKLTFGDGITMLGGSSLFVYLTSLETVTIPASVTELKDYLFMKCNNLKTVYFKGDAPTEIQKFVFGDPKENPDLVIYYPKDASGWDNTKLSQYKLQAY